MILVLSQTKGPHVAYKEFKEKRKKFPHNNTFVFLQRDIGDPVIFPIFFFFFFIF